LQGKGIFNLEGAKPLPKSTSPLSFEERGSRGEVNYSRKRRKYYYST
jgi:hypothetical protein